METVDAEDPAEGRPKAPDGETDAEQADAGQEDAVQQDTVQQDTGQQPEAPAWDDAPPLETAQLALGDDDVRLPWLEADDDDEAEYRGGYETGQVVTLAVLGLLALAVIGGGIWWALGQRSGEVPVADGSVIAAPEQPYKQRPEDPGGKTFAGTGDTSFAVSEGQTRPARLGVADTPKPAAQASGAAGAAAPSGVGVQVAAYSSRASAEAGWTRLSAQYEVLSGVSHRVVEGTADIGTVYRLQAVPGDAAAAQALCGKLKAEGLACQVKN